MIPDIFAPERECARDNLPRPEPAYGGTPLGFIPETTRGRPIVPDSTLLPELIALSASRRRTPRPHLWGNTLSYAELDRLQRQFRNGLLALGLERGERVAVYLEKRFETVVTSFGATAAGGSSSPQSLLKPDQVAYILRDCNVRVLVTSPERLACSRLSSRPATICGRSSSPRAKPIFPHRIP